MKLPKGMTEQDVMDTIELVVNRMAPRYKFYGFEVDDIKQESFLLCMDALTRYQEGRPLENFLASHLSKRLKNLIRDNHFNKNDDEEKKKIKMPGQLSNECDMHYYETFMLDQLDVSEITTLVDEKLPYEYRTNYLKMINNVHVPKKEQIELIEVIKEIVSEAGYE